jgi:hypothetical protein
MGAATASTANRRVEPTTRCTRCESFTTPPGGGITSHTPTDAPAAIAAAVAHVRGATAAERSRTHIPKAKNTPNSTTSPTCHGSCGANAGRHGATRWTYSRATSATAAAAAATPGARRTRRAINGASSRIHRSVRRYHNGVASQPPSHVDPAGSPRGTIHHHTRPRSRLVPEARAPHAITIQANAPKSHRGGPSRRNRLHTAGLVPRREADAANREPDTKNMSGMAATRVTTAAPVACHTTTRTSAAARTRSRARSRGAAGPRFVNGGWSCSGTGASAPRPTLTRGAVSADRRG